MSHFLNAKTSNFASTLPIQVQTELRIQNYTVQVKERIASGGFGFVDLVLDVHTKSEFVLKRCNVATKEGLDVVHKEVKILQTFSGPYIVKILASDMTTMKSGTSGGIEALILLEYCPGGHLLDRLKARNNSQLPPNSIYRIFGQILLAVNSLHSYDPIVVHRDLKLENILFGSDGNVRLCDFGSCVYGHVFIRNADERANAEEVIEKTTTQIYRAPEMVDLYLRQVLTEKTDVWALGCIFYALIFLLHPFQDCGSLGILGGKLSFPQHLSINDDAKTVLLRMLDLDPEARPSVKDCFQALNAIATNNPLPPYKLSEEALQRRKEREDAALRREQKLAAKKHSANSNVPIRQSDGHLDSNSVAARRLAAKKGIILNPPTVPNPSTKPSESTQLSNTQSAESFSNFADFSGFNSDPPAKPARSSVHRNVDNFEADIFGSSSTGFDTDPFGESFTTNNDFSTTKNSITTADLLFDDSFNVANHDDTFKNSNFANHSETEAAVMFEAIFEQPSDSFGDFFSNPSSSSKLSAKSIVSSTSSKILTDRNSFSAANDLDPFFGKPASKQQTSISVGFQSVDFMNDSNDSIASMSIQPRANDSSLQPTKISATTDLFSQLSLSGNKSYGTSTVDVMEMFDSPKKPSVQRVAPEKPMKPTYITSAVMSSPSTNDTIVMTTNPAFGRTFSTQSEKPLSRPPNAPSFASNPPPPIPLMSRSASVGASQLNYAPFRGLNATQSKRKDPFDVLNIIPQK